MGIKLDTLSAKQKEIPAEFKDLAKDFVEKGFITTSTNNLINWADIHEIAPALPRIRFSGGYKSCQKLF